MRPSMQHISRSQTNLDTYDACQTLNDPPRTLAGYLKQKRSANQSSQQYKVLDKVDSENYNSTVYALEDSEHKSTLPTPMQYAPIMQIKTYPDAFSDAPASLNLQHSQSAKALPKIKGGKSKSRNNASVYNGPVKAETELHRELSLPLGQQFTMYQ